MAKVAGVEDRDFGGTKQSFYLLELHRGGNVLLPTTNVDSEGLRPLVSTNKAKALMRKMKSRPDIQAGEAFKARAAGYNDDLRSGDADRYTEVLRDLMYRGKEDKLSTSEQNLLDSARSLFLAELSTVLGVSEDKLDDDLTAAVEKGS